MSSTGQDEPAVFERKMARSGNQFWDELELPHLPECDPLDKGWLCSMLHSITCKQMGQVTEPPKYSLSHAQRMALTQKYERIYLNELDIQKGIDRENLARRKANIMLRTAIENFELMAKQ